MKIDAVNTNVYSTSFKHTSSDIYIATRRFINMDTVRKNLFRSVDPWYKKILYPFEDLADLILKNFRSK